MLHDVVRAAMPAARACRPAGWAQQHLAFMLQNHEHPTHCRVRAHVWAVCLQVAMPVMKTTGAAGAGGRKAVRDENASYQALLDDFARGV